MHNHINIITYAGYKLWFLLGGRNHEEGRVRRLLQDRHDAVDFVILRTRMRKSVQSVALLVKDGYAQYRGRG